MFAQFGVFERRATIKCLQMMYRFCLHACVRSTQNTNKYIFSDRANIRWNSIVKCWWWWWWSVVFKFCIYFIRYTSFNAFNVCMSTLGHGACGFVSKCYTRYIYIFWASDSLFKVFSNEIVWNFPLCTSLVFMRMQYCAM